MLYPMGSARRIGEVARLTGISVAAIRYYEEEGLLRPVGRTEGGYRLYEDETISRLRFIARSKALGLRLAEIAEILRAPDAAAEREAVRHGIAHRLASVHQQVDELQSLERSLERLYVQVNRESCDCRHLGDCACLPGPATSAEIAVMAEETAAVEAGRCTCGCGT